APPLISETAPESPTRPTDSYGEALKWGISLEGPYSQVRTKLGFAGQVDCRDIHGYSAPVPRDDPGIGAAPLPEKDGVYFLCIIGLTGVSEPDVRFPMVVVAAIDTTPPKESPRVIAARTEGGGIRIALLTNPPEIAHYHFAFGPLATTDCKTADLS